MYGVGFDLGSRRLYFSFNWIPVPERPGSYFLLRYCPKPEIPPRSIFSAQEKLSAQGTGVTLIISSSDGRLTLYSERSIVVLTWSSLVSSSSSKISCMGSSSRLNPINENKSPYPPKVPDGLLPLPSFGPRLISLVIGWLRNSLIICSFRRSNFGRSLASCFALILEGMPRKFPAAFRLLRITCLIFSRLKNAIRVAALKTSHSVVVQKCRLDADYEALGIFCRQTPHALFRQEIRAP